MSQPYIGEIRMVGFSFAPVGWALCNGALMAISENDTLFNLIGTTYGGDGQSTFALPNLQSRVPVHMGTGAGQSYVIGQMAGEEQVTLTTNQIPSHSHVPLASAGGGTLTSPSNAVWASASSLPYSNNAPNAAMAAQAVQSSGGSQPHDNMLPYLAINFVISLYGVYPSPT
jgi:microcystin-dependent protein